MSVSCSLRHFRRHEGLKQAIAQVPACPWQRCAVHFAHYTKGRVSKTQHQMIGAAIAQIFSAPDGAEARRHLGAVVATLECSARRVAFLLEAAEDDLLAHLAFPPEHRSKLRSTNPSSA